MRGLESFAEGEFRIGPLKVTRKYISISCFPEDNKNGQGEKYTHYTCVENTEKPVVC
jgi:hypothetical protein